MGGGGGVFRRLCYGLCKGEVLGGLVVQGAVSLHMLEMHAMSGAHRLGAPIW